VTWDFFGAAAAPAETVAGMAIGSWHFGQRTRLPARRSSAFVVNRHEAQTTAIDIDAPRSGRSRSGPKMSVYLTIEFVANASILWRRGRFLGIFDDVNETGC
jgi:hypothetical protein